MIKHRTFIFILSFFLISVSVVASAATQRGIVPVPIKDRSGNQVLLYQESHALLVGVSEYTQGWPNLPGVREDINEVKVALEQKGFHTVVVINPTRVELRGSIEKFINLYGQDVDNRLIFYFAGHGHTLKLSYGEEMGYFVPADAPNPNMDKSGFLATSLNMESIEVYSKQVQSKHALFLFDSCFSGSIFSLSRAIPENISFKTSKPVRQFITAGSANETVPDVSIFNDQFIRALNGEGDLDGDGYLTGVELGEFLQKTVINYSKGSQHPQYGKIRNPNLDKGDFVFSLLDRRHIEQSIDSMVREREKLEQKRLKLEEERKRVAVLQRMQEEKKKLEEEKRRLKEEQDRLARLSPSLEENFSVGAGKWVQIMTKATPLRIRAKPNSKSKVVAQIRKGLVVPVFRGTKGWYQINYQVGKKGWILRRYVRLLDDPSEAMPNGQCPKKMSFIPGGVFLAGEDGGHLWPEHELSVNAFCMDKYEVTQAEYEAVVGDSPSHFKGANRPVEKVNWYEAEAYCQKAGKRLPTEWEWEKAAKAGTTTRFYWGNVFFRSNNAHCNGCGSRWDGEETAPVGSFEPNPWGLYDMLGNVWEWTSERNNNPEDKTKGLRGGSWETLAKQISPAFRLGDDPSIRDNIFGFRCAQ
jgi:formylglycine-generating enzyme required for sulfatase activity